MPHSPLSISDGAAVLAGVRGLAALQQSLDVPRRGGVVRNVAVAG